MSTTTGTGPHWYRSWPDRIPPGRAHVIDSLPRLVMRDCNYATLAEYQPWPRHEPGWFMLEWDIALGRRERAQFAAHVLADPELVHVAPYPIYSGTQARQVHRDVSGGGLREGDTEAEMFGFGCIYFPQAVLDRFWSEPPMRLQRTGELTDTVFSDWHRQRYDPAVVDWSTRPQHLHGD